MENDDEEKEIKIELPELNFLNQVTDNRVKDNHIYFYSDVTTRSCLSLIEKLTELEKSLLTKQFKHKNHQEYIYLHINSNGGSVFAAFGVIDTIKNLRVPVVSIIEGSAASAATLISISCDYKLITPNSYMLIHELSSAFWGKFTDFENEIDNLENLMRRIRHLYKKFTNLTSKDLDKVLRDDIWWDSDICLEYGLVDEVLKKKKTYKFNRESMDL